jgi:hypothetical protein
MKIVTILSFALVLLASGVVVDQGRAQGTTPQSGERGQVSNPSPVASVQAQPVRTGEGPMESDVRTSPTNPNSTWSTTFATNMVVALLAGIMFVLAGWIWFFTGPTEPTLPQTPHRP